MAFGFRGNMYEYNVVCGCHSRFVNESIVTTNGFQRVSILVEETYNSIAWHVCRGSKSIHILDILL